MMAKSCVTTNKGYNSEFCLESYMFNVPSVTYIQCIARLRLSSHNLNIELGRHAKPKLPVADRLCSRCSLGAVDNECHFLIDCTAFSNERAILFGQLQSDLPGFISLDSYDKFVSIMSSKCQNVNFQLSKFLHKCLPK